MTIMTGPLNDQARGIEMAFALWSGWLLFVICGAVGYVCLWCAKRSMDAARDLDRIMRLPPGVIRQITGDTPPSASWNDERGNLRG